MTPTLLQWEKERISETVESMKVDRMGLFTEGLLKGLLVEHRQMIAKEIEETIKKSRTTLEDSGRGIFEVGIRESQARVQVLIDVLSKLTSNEEKI